MGGKLLKSAEFAATNPKVNSDVMATFAQISIRASASTLTNFFLKDIEDKRESINPKLYDSLISRLGDAIKFASVINENNLVKAYETYKPLKKGNGD